ncbi:helix-turn-helix domain-containing protein [Micromonospora arborensis]|uniref:helix-turn-helix domain-containing protein n=1 Tax=Micromonospora arborensis TaxID=2116518 RepID=UPI0033C2F987
MLRELLDGRTYRDVADRLGWAPSTLSRLLKARRVQRDTADRITQLHRLLVKPVAEPATSRRGRPARDLAERPADPVLVQLAVGGEVPWEELAVQDRQAVVAELMRLGLSIRDSAARLRVTGRTVCRWRARSLSPQNS